jgi:hypothetical protein
MMQVSDPLNTLSHAIHSAVMNDLPDISYEYKGESKSRRPRREDLDVTLFSQQWSSTALGFENTVAGQAFTTAYTVVVIHERTACVYFGERLAYKVDTRNANFRDDACNLGLEGQAEARARYNAQTS